MYRKATLQDGERVYALICDMEQTRLPFQRFSAIYQRQVEDRAYYALVREEAGAVLGVLNLRFEEQLHHAGRIAEILEFAVDPACRNRGVGKALFAEACRLAKEAGCVQIEVACNQLRTDTHRFYEREGMHNFHFKFSKPLLGADTGENALGK